jgi:hypothetical protein
MNAPFFLMIAVFFATKEEIQLNFNKNVSKLNSALRNKVVYMLIHFKLMVRMLATIKKLMALHPLRHFNAQQPHTFFYN